MTTRRGTHWRMMPGVVLVAALLAGSCTAGPASSTAPRGDAGQAAAAGPAVDLLTRSGSYQRNQNALTLAEAVLVQRCMKARGMEYPIDGRIVSDLSYLERELRMAERRERGYGLSGPKPGSAEPEQDSAASQSDDHVRTLPPDEQQAYMRALFGPDSTRRTIGVPDGGQITVPGAGCAADSRAQLYGDVLTEARVQYVPQRINTRLSSQVSTAPAYRDAIARWSACMKRRGYAYATPEAAQRSLRERSGDGGADETLRRQEIEVAVADGECARRERIPLVALDVKRALFDTLPDQERDAMRELAEAWTIAARKAENVIRDQCRKSNAPLPGDFCPKR